MKPDMQKPFGLQIAVKIAAKALKESNSPSSTVLYNLLSLQKDTIFPKDLDVNYFTKPNQGINVDKRIVSKLLDEMKKPQIDILNLLEKNIEEGWVKKKNPPMKVESPLKRHVVKQKKPPVKTVKVEPTIVIKKNKLSI